MKIIKLLSPFIIVMLSVFVLKAGDINNSSSVKSTEISEALRNGEDFLIKNPSQTLPTPVFLKKESASVLKSSNSLSIDLNSVGRLKKTQATGDTLIIQGFEGSNGVADWLPNGWTRKVQNTVPNCTWYMTTPLIQLDANNKYLPYVYFNGDNASDEWLITPQITLGQKNDLLFYLLSTPSKMYLQDNNGVYHKDQVKATFQVMVSVNGGEWQKIFDAATDVVYTDAEFEITGYRQMNVDLAAYSGQNVKLGFRYIGQGGGSMGFDNVFVGNVKPLAWYLRPAGTYYNGFSNTAMIAPGFFVPAYKNLRYANLSQYATSFEWLGLDKGGYEYLQSDQAEPEFSISTSGANLPYLTAKWKENSDMYYYNNNGRSELLAGHKANVMNVDLNCGLTTYKQENNYLFGSFKYTSTSPEYRSYSYEAVGNWFEKPAQKAVVSSVSVFMGAISGPQNTELTLDAMRVDEQGNLVYLTSGKATIADTTSAGGLKILKFAFNEALQVDYPVLYMLKGFNIPNVTLGVYSNYYFDADESNAFILIKFTDNNETLLRNAQNAYGGGLSLVFVPELVFPVLHSDKDTIDCTISGGMEQIQVETSYSSSLSYLINDNWVRMTNSTYNSADGKFTLDLAYDALPEGQQGRSTSLILSQYGTDDLVIPFRQGNVTGISDIKYPNLKVTNTGNAFEFTCNENVKNVEVFNTSGQAVAKISLPESGQYSMNHNHLPTGVYIFKFSGTKGIQVIKEIK